MRKEREIHREEPRARHFSLRRKHIFHLRDEITIITEAEQQRNGKRSILRAEGICGVGRGDVDTPEIHTYHGKHRKNGGRERRGNRSSRARFSSIYARRTGISFKSNDKIDRPSQGNR